MNNEAKRLADHIETCMPESMLFNAEVFFERHGAMLVQIDGMTTGEAIDIMVEEHDFDVHEAKPLAVALSSYGILK